MKALVLAVFFEAGSCAHREAPAPEVPHPPPASATSAASSLEQIWREKADRRHDGFASRGAFELRSVETAPRVGYRAMALSGDEREKLAISAEQQIYLSEHPVIDSGAVQGAHVRVSRRGEPPELSLAIEWTPEGRRAFKEVSRAHVGRKLAIMLHHRIVSMPTVMEAIDSAEILFVSSEMSPRENLAQLLRELNPPVDADALATLRRECQDGRVPACRLLATEALRGRDMPHDPELAFVLLRSACERGDGGACHEAVTVAVDHRLSSRVADSMELLKKGCELAHLPSCHAGAMLLTEKGSWSQAKPLLVRCCDGKLAISCYKLAELTYRREPTGRRAKAIELMERSCQYGHAQACIDLGELALQSTTPDLQAARRWFTSGCALDPQQGTYFKPCRREAGEDSKEQLMRSARCPVVNLRCSEP